MQTRGILIVVLVLVVVVVGWWRVEEPGGEKRKGGEGKECNDSDSDDGWWQFSRNYRVHRRTLNGCQHGIARARGMQGGDEGG